MQQSHNEALSGKRGASFTYSAQAIEVMLIVQAVFRLPLRGTQGFVISIFALQGACLAVPDYTTLCRRRKTLRVDLASKLEKVKPGEQMHILVDGTGLKIFGEGEWKVRQHGYDKRPGALWADGGNCTLPSTRIASSFARSS